MLLAAGIKDMRINLGSDQLLDPVLCGGNISRQFAAVSAAATLIIMQALVDSGPNFCVSFNII
jgi:hypothetical protein